MNVTTNFKHEKEWAFSPYPITTEKEPANTLRVMGWKNLPKIDGPKIVRVTNPSGKTSTVTLDKHALQVLMGLMTQPLYSSSLARIGEYVRVLKVEHDIEIHTERYDSNGYGAYFLVSKIELIDGEPAQ